MKYKVTFAPEAQKGLAMLKRSEPVAFNKDIKLFNDTLLCYSWFQF